MKGFFARSLFSALVSHSEGHARDMTAHVNLGFASLPLRFSDYYYFKAVCSNVAR